MNAALGRKQEFEVLLKENDVGRAIAQMTDNSKRVGEALKVYETKQHDVMKRPKRLFSERKIPQQVSENFYVGKRNGRYLFLIRSSSMR